MADAEQKELPDVSTYAGYAKAIHDFSINQVEQLKEIDRRIRSYDLTPDMAADGLAMTIEGFINTVIQTRLKIYEASQPTHPVDKDTDVTISQGETDINAAYRKGFRDGQADSKLHEYVGISQDGELEKSIDDIIEDLMIGHNFEYAGRALKELFAAHLQAAVREAERHGRANEHHVISDILDNEDIAALKPDTRRRLKARQAELCDTDRESK